MYDGFAIDEMVYYTSLAKAPGLGMSVVISGAERDSFFGFQYRHWTWRSTDKQRTTAREGYDLDKERY